MADKTGFTIELSSRYDGWWRYNVALMCGCFTADNERIGFVSAQSHVADVGSGLTARPASLAANRSVQLTTEPCDHLLFYLYIVPHALPADNDIEATKSFEVTLKISYGGTLIRSEKREINQWSGASSEIRIERETI
ncbi:MAG: hypothetical protein RRY33_06050 [Alistipes sp.]